MSKKLSELTAVTTLADADVMYAAQSPFGATDSKKITVGNLKTVFGGGGGGSSTIVQAMIDPQVNISSQGVTTTDTVGNTFQEPAGQTRMTLTNLRTFPITCGFKISGHVNAGTGTFQLYNFTDGTSVGTTTTSATVETSLTTTTSTLVTNNGDDITIRVKNSGAGNTITIDCGGLFCGDFQLNPITTAYNFLNAQPLGGYATSIKVAILKAFSTNTGTLYVAEGGGGTTATATITNLGVSFSASDHGTVITRSMTKKLYSQGVGVYATALSGSTGFLCIASHEVKAEDI